MRARNNKYIEIYPSCKQIYDFVDIGASHSEINHAKVTMIISCIVFYGKYFIVFRATIRDV